MGGKHRGECGSQDRRQCSNKVTGFVSFFFSFTFPKLVYDYYFGIEPGARHFFFNCQLSMGQWQDDGIAISLKILMANNPCYL